MERLPLDAKKKIAESLTYDEIINLCKTSKSMKNICTDDRFWREKILMDFPGTRLSKVPLDKMEAKYLYLLILVMDHDLDVMVNKSNNGGFKDRDDLLQERYENWRQQERFEKKGQTDLDEYKQLQKRFDEIEIALKDWDKWFEREYHKIDAKMKLYLHNAREIWPKGEPKETKKIK
jgi:hypothetical protein